MADLLCTGAAWLAQQRTAHCASPVVYERASHTESIDAVATYGRTDVTVGGEDGFSIESHVIDFLIAADDLPAEPEAGDRILAEGRTFEVMDVAGTGAWRWSDAYRHAYRIHTRDIGEAE